MIEQPLRGKFCGAGLVNVVFNRSNAVHAVFGDQISESEFLRLRMVPQLKAAASGRMRESYDDSVSAFSIDLVSVLLMEYLIR